MQHYDIVMVTDARLPGGTSASVAEEIRAQARAGYRTALLQVDSPLVRHQRAFSPRLRECMDRGEVDLLVDDAPVGARLVVVRHPSVAASIDPAVVPRVAAEERLLIANQAAGTPASAAVAAGQADAVVAEAGALRYEPQAVEEHLAAWLGGAVRWAPIGPLVREDLIRVAPSISQEPDDWLNVIDVDAWRRPRDGSRHRIPVIGRHSREDVLKWPEDRRALLAAYPDRPDVEVHVLGGAGPAERLLSGELPDNWQVLPFGAVPPARFLAGLDIYVYQHHPAWVEAFGRSILEALASGLPTVLGPHFAALFEDAAVYASVDDTWAAVRDLHDDRDRYQTMAARATAFAADRFGHQVHLDRLAALIGPPSRTLAPSAVAPAGGVAAVAAPRSAGGASRVLLVSSNGAGVGHLMRLLAYARRAGDGVEPLFLTFSQGGQVVDDEGYLVEYLASRSLSGARAVVWHPMLRARIGELIERYDVRAVVFDGTWPYQGILDAAADHPHVQLIWSRRAMWREGVTNPVLEHERDRFDLVIEPGELAGDDDRGATRRFRKQARRVAPVTLLDVADLASREEARAELGLDPDRPAALVHLGAGNIDDPSSVLAQVVSRLGRQPELQVRVTRSIISERQVDLPDNVASISVYPLARVLPAFDLAIAAPGYNSFHELSMAAVPTVYVPNLLTSTDDQGARARYAQRVGIGLSLPEPDPTSIDRALTELLDPARRRRMHERALARRADNGAGAAMQAIAELLETGPRGRPTPLELQRAAAARASGALSTPQFAPLRRRSTQARAADLRDPAAADVTAAPSDAAPLVALRRQRRRLQKRAVVVASDERVRSRVRAPFNALPTTWRRAIRRSLRRWERRARRTQLVRLEPLPVPVGLHLPRFGIESARPVGIVVPSLGSQDRVDRIVDRIAQHQVAHRSFAPLLLLGDLSFRAARRHGYLVEYLPPPDRYQRLETPQPWADAYRARLSSLVDWFALEELVVLPAGADDATLDAVLAVALGRLPSPLGSETSRF